MIYIVLTVAGLAFIISLSALLKYLRRQYVLKVRMPILRKLRYRPKRPDRYYRLHGNDQPENGKPV